jgi:hypothetical protein
MNEARRNSGKAAAIVRLPRRSVQILAVLGRLALAAFKGLIVAIIVWRVALYALESKTSPYVDDITIGALVAFALATVYFLIWPSPLGDARDWDEIFHVPAPREHDEGRGEMNSSEEDRPRN